MYRHFNTPKSDKTLFVDYDNDFFQTTISVIIKLFHSVRFVLVVFNDYEDTYNNVFCQILNSLKNIKTYYTII